MIVTEAVVADNQYIILLTPDLSPLERLFTAAGYKKQECEE
jgi:hypothetical protein